MSRLLCALLLFACAAPSSPTASVTPPVAEENVAGEGLPYVVSSSGLLGYFDGRAWVAGTSVTEVRGGETYQIIDLQGVLDSATGSQLTVCEPIGTPMIKLDPPLPVGPTAPGAVALASPGWDPVPRAVNEDGEAPRELIEQAGAFLANRGIDDPEPAIAQYLTFDLEGDGVDEEILVVRRIPDDLFGNASSYSLVLMLKSLDAEDGTLVIEFSQGAADNPYVVSHRVTAIADLNGDAKLEIVIDGYYYEGSGTSVWEYVDDDLGTVAALSAGCGA